MEKVIVLLSGGMDSLVCAGMATQNHENVYALHMNYGQKTSSREKISFDEMLQKIPKGTINENLEFSYLKESSKTMENFDIDSTQVNQINFGDDGVTYTMEAIPKSGYNSDEELYNLIVTQIGDDVEYRIIKYSLENGELVVDDSHISTEYSSSNRQSCRIIIEPCQYGYYHDDAHCISTGWTLTLSCTGDGNTGGGGTGTGTADGPTTPTGNHHTPQDGGSSGYQYEYYYYIQYSNTPNYSAIINWLSGHSYIAQQLDSVIRNIPDSEQAQSFAVFAAKFFYENQNTSWTQFQNWFLNDNFLIFSSAVNSTNSLNFSSLSDFRNALVNKNSNMILESSIVSDSGTEKIISAKVKRTGIWGSGIEVLIKLNKVNNVWIFDSVSSGEYGLTFGAWSFTQSAYTQNTYNNVLRVEVTGYENYNIFAEGIGTIHKDKVRIRVNIDISTGNIIDITFIDL